MKVCVIGIGNIGKHHVRIYSEIPEIEFTAISDINETTGSVLAKKFRIKFYRDFEEMLATELPDFVSICVPTSLHYKIAKICIKKKINVLIEKPITEKIDDAKELIRLSKKYNVKLFVGHVERFNPAVKKVKEMINKNDLGKITAIIARRVGGFPPQIKDADVTIDLAIHDIDVINYLLEQTPKSVYYNKQKNHIKNREDSVEIFLKYQNTSAYIQANWITPVKIRKLTITGTEGYLELDYITQKIEFYKSNYKKFKEASKNFSDYIMIFSDPDKINISVAKKEPLKEELLHYINCVKNNIDMDPTFAVDALKIATSSSNYDKNKKN
ncbi:MAG TPA: Gfo/Idh/MocA family oxidoreductase [Candidatus Woesebacteria bacterium]|nr:Gfo/Idh/MocA family oxidoreductase [Candidatus Woesebacteria bacterium]